jgi:hypothetical protein
MLASANQSDIDRVPRITNHNSGTHRAKDVMGRSLRSLKKSHAINKIHMINGICLGISLTKPHYLNSARRMPMLKVSLGALIFMLNNTSNGKI